MQTLKDKSMIEICKEEGVSPKQVCFCSFMWSYHYELSKHKFCVCEGQLIFSGDQEEK